MKKTIAIAGATGFIGKWFIKTYKNKFNIIGLSRNQVEPNYKSEISWRQVDLYSISSTTDALKNVDIGIYLVHSMQPTTRMNQGSFEDTDLLLADNFCRAATTCKLEQIIYLGGILPKDGFKMSKHLKSRFEVEKILGSRSTPLTSIRAGIIIGPDGSSFKIVQKLVENLPLMACPEWTKSLNQPLDILDALKVINWSINNIESYNKSIEIGGNEVITYMELLKMTAKKMKKKRIIFSFSYITIGLSKLWVSLITGSSQNFISPLVESLKHKMTLSEENKFELNNSFMTLNESIEKALDPNEELPKNPKFKSIKFEKNTVRSVQRIANPSKKTAEFFARIYPIWLTKRFARIIKANFDGKYVKFYLLGILLLELKVIKSRSDKSRQLFFITGGILVKRRNLGWLEFRSVLDDHYLIAAIHEYVPRLPWLFYKYTQAKVHLLVMKQFENFLLSIPKKYPKRGKL